MPKVYFNTSGGGSLEGETMQESERYEDLMIPTPKPEENFVFTEWIPAIPESGEIEGNKTFTALFESTIPAPDPEPGIEERVATLENDVQMINEALGGE